MASNERVRAAWNAAIKHLVTKGWANAPDPGDTWSEDWLEAMSAALDAADAFALTPAQREAEGMLAMLRQFSDDWARDSHRSSVRIVDDCMVELRAILARIDGGK
jgi:hypothetical protein